MQRSVAITIESIQLHPGFNQNLPHMTISAEDLMKYETHLRNLHVSVDDRYCQWSPGIDAVKIQVRPGLDKNLPHMTLR